ncbi:MAG: negative regulator of septation ring formation, partial [Mesorhizobium sp.]|nr:negative regulator of septation ring formation [Mesorhizobium sp.]
MANTPKKVKDPTEVALSAIQEALNISDTAADTSRNASMQNETAPQVAPPAPPVFDEPSFEPRPAANERATVFDTVEEPRSSRRAANDDRETIGQLLQALQKGRPARSVYTFATIFAGVWLAACAALTFGFLPSIQAAMGQSGGVLVIAGLIAMFFAPIMLFYFLASLVWRGQEMRMIAQAMAQVAIRFSEPEGSASDSMVTVGQAIRREVAAMGDGIERAIARAGELETLVA